MATLLIIEVGGVEVICIRSRIFLGVDSHTLVQNASLHLKGSHYYSDEPMKKQDTDHDTGRLQDEGGARIPSLSEVKVELAARPLQ